MNKQEAEKVLKENIIVTLQMVIIAKSYMFDIIDDIIDTTTVINRLCMHEDAILSKSVNIHDNNDPVSNLKKAGNAISWQLAGCEAIWGLVHAGILMIKSSTSLECLRLDLECTDGRYAGGFNLREYDTPIPLQISRSLSSKSLGTQFLANHDLYIHQVNIPNINPQVESALGEAVNCFKYELFLACVTMLGKASEGAWLDLGASLVNIIPPNYSSLGRIVKQLNDPQCSISKKIEDVIELYNHQDVYKAVSEQSQISLQELRNIQLWSDIVRDSRNAIHISVFPAVPNTYEKVASLLLGAVPSLRKLYAIKKTADELAQR